MALDHPVGTWVDEDTARDIADAWQLTGRRSQAEYAREVLARQARKDCLAHGVVRAKTPTTGKAVIGAHNGK